MKKLKRKEMAVLCAAAIAFAGCAKDQSSMTLGDIEGRATVIGSLSYSTGMAYDKVNGCFHDDVIPADGKRVYIEIENSSLKATAEGVTVFETQTDIEGNFSIEIPATSDGVQISVWAEPFTGTYARFDGMADNSPSFKEQAVIYKASALLADPVVKANGLIAADMVYTPVDRQVAEQYTEMLTFKGSILIGVLKKQKTTTNDTTYDEIVPIYTYAGRGVNVIATVTGENMVPIKYGTTTSFKGEYTIRFAAPSKTGRYTVEIQALPYMDKQFEFMYYIYGSERQIKTTSISGIYKQTSSYETTVDFAGIEGYYPTVAPIRMTLEPLAGELENGQSMPSWGSAEIKEN